MRVVLALLLLLAAGAAGAQCVPPPNSGFMQPNPWPTTASFVPANPAPGAPVAIVLGAPLQAHVQAPQVSVSGATITLAGQLDVLAILPPPPATLSVALGAFPAGTYTVRVRFGSVEPGGPACNPLDATLVVGNGIATAAPVPVWSALASFCLVLLLAGAAWRRAYRHPAR